MSDSSHKALLKILRLLYKPHPWHGISIGKHMPDRVRAFIEIVPTDTVKYELDKTTGYLKVDRPLKYSSVYPTLYGFIPQMVCGEESAALCARRTRRRRVVGDGDPLDICILSEKDFTHGDIVLDAVPIGGLRMLDGNQADDKIIAVLVGDAVYGGWRDIRQSPPMLVEPPQTPFPDLQTTTRRAQSKRPDHPRLRPQGSTSGHSSGPHGLPETFCRSERAVHRRQPRVTAVRRPPRKPLIPYEETAAWGKGMLIESGVSRSPWICPVAMRMTLNRISRRDVP